MTNPNKPTTGPSRAKLDQRFGDIRFGQVDPADYPTYEVGLLSETEEICCLLQTRPRLNQDC